jgi:hypothetical protein
MATVQLVATLVTVIAVFAGAVWFASNHFLSNRDLSIFADRVNATLCARHQEALNMRTAFWTREATDFQNLIEDIDTALGDLAGTADHRSLANLQSSMERVQGQLEIAERRRDAYFSQIGQPCNFISWDH